MRKYASKKEVVPPPTEKWKDKVEGVTIVKTVKEAKKVVSLLQKITDVYHACDTETTEIDLDNQSPVGNGTVLCASIFCGPEFDFGSGPCIWIDNYGESENVLLVFKEYFENEKIKKVWHNYSFDRHVLYNHSINVKGFGGDTMHMARLWDTARLTMGGYSLEGLTRDLNISTQKISMKDRFSSPKIRKDGTEGKTSEMPSTLQLHTDPRYRPEWIQYSVTDAEATWNLRDCLELKLKLLHWKRNKTMWDFYYELMLPFGEVLTDMEREGIKVNVDYLRELEPLAQQHINGWENKFKEWACKYNEDARFMNVSSDIQRRQILFAPCENRKTSELLERTKTFEVPNVYNVIYEGQTKPPKNIPITLKGLGVPPITYAASGWPQVGHPVLKNLCGSPRDTPPSYGKLYTFFNRTEEGKEACEAIDALCEVSSVNTLLSSFIVPLQQMVDSNNRIHASMNINTETGRLSCRRPNLQNQPALEKDRYKIRSAFICEPGNTLIVADYGQLELRLLAHVTKCKSMIDAFAKGGDFHSRTAMGMYPEVAKAVEKGDVLLEWNSKNGEPPAPLLKDVYATERRRAKVLNFSIAYGKTAHGLAKDWEVSLDEAQRTLDLWYADRPEVLEWQNKTIMLARKTGYTRTLMGRYRRLPDINSENQLHRNHSERAAINTPLQGGAADVAMKAMLLLHKHKRLAELGWKLILQIHDELILEGPKESVEEAMLIVNTVMKSPLYPQKLLIDLQVDAHNADNWMSAK